MTRHVPNPHSPEQERAYSNVGHGIEGAIITTVGLTLARAALTGDDAHDQHASRFLVAAGALLGAGLVAGSFHHGGPIRFFRADHQQRQHLEMSAWILGAGLARPQGRLGAVVSDALVARVGQMFLTHEQHGTSQAAADAKAKHERLGGTIVAAAAVQTLGDLSKRRALRSVGAALMIAAGLQLLLYREPQGAYETH